MRSCGVNFENSEIFQIFKGPEGEIPQKFQIFFFFGKNQVSRLYEKSNRKIECFQGKNTVISNINNPYLTLFPQSCWDRSSQVWLGQVKAGLVKSKFFLTKDCLGPKLFLTKNVVGPKINIQDRLSQFGSSQIK